ncbi:histidinol-phosphate aminotransferase family protein, partial [Thermococci archaeon]
MNWKEKIRTELFNITIPGGYADKVPHREDILDCSLGTNP